MMVGARGGGRRELKGVEGMKWWWLRGRNLTRGGIMQVKECGADVNAASNDGVSAVMAAAMGGHTATVVALVRAGRRLRESGGEGRKGVWEDGRW